MSEIPVILSFPLPFRVLALTGLGILGWATNLHGLDLLGVDVVAALDLRVEADHNPHLPPHLSGGPKQPSHPSVIYNAVFRIFAAYAFWCLFCWAVFRYLTYGDMALVDAFGYIPAISALVVLLVLVSPIDVFYKCERDKFLQWAHPFLSRSTGSLLFQFHSQVSVYIDGWANILLGRRIC